MAINYAPAVTAQPTGVGYYTRFLTQELLKLETPLNWLIYTPSAAPELLPSQRVIIKEGGPTRFYTTLGLTLKLLADRPDGFFAPNSILPLYTRSKRVVAIHDLAWKYAPDDYRSSETLQLEIVMRRAAQLSQQIIVPTENTKRDVVKFLDVEPNRISVIPFGINPRFGEPRGERPISAPYLVTVGTHRRKNLPMLLAAFLLLKKERLPHKLVIIGAKNPLDITYQEALKSLGELRSEVIETGYLSEKETIQYVSHAECFVFPTRYEGFGLPILEAMAASIPVVTSKLPILEEVAGSAAIYIDRDTPLEWAATISRVLHSPKLRLQMISKGKKRVIRYSWQKTAEQTLAIFERLLW